MLSLSAKTSKASLLGRTTEAAGAFDKQECSTNHATVRNVSA